MFFAGLSHIILRIIASPTEEQLITTNPQDLLDAGKNMSDVLASGQQPASALQNAQDSASTGNSTGS